MIIFIRSLTVQLEHRGFAPIGMLEGWNSGIMGHGKLEWWIVEILVFEKRTRTTQHRHEPC